MAAREGWCVGQKMRTIIAPEEVLISACQSSRVITFRFNCRFQRQMFQYFTTAIFVPPTWHLQSFIYLPGETLFRVRCEWNTAETYFLARLFIYQSSIPYHIPDLTHWMVTIILILTWQSKPAISVSDKVTDSLHGKMRLPCFLCRLLTCWAWKFPFATMNHRRVY